MEAVPSIGFVVRGCLLLTLMTTPADGRLNLNVAFNKTCYSSYPDTINVPKKGVDGNKDPDYTRGGCSYNLAKTYSWWAVDLGRRAYIGGVNFTNTLVPAYSQRNLIVGLTNDPPDIYPPAIWNYTLCAQWQGDMAAGATVYIQCRGNPPPFRYVVLQTPVLDVFVVCELEVFLRRFDWRRRSGSRMTNILKQTEQVSEFLFCEFNCTKLPYCDSFNFRPSDKTCQYVTHPVQPMVASSVDIVSDPDWEWWSNVFTVVN